MRKLSASGSSSGRDCRSSSANGSYSSQTTTSSLVGKYRKKVRGEIASASGISPTLIAVRPEQGWSRLCNGVILFDDAGVLLPNGRAIPPPTPLHVREPVAA